MYAAYAFLKIEEEKKILLKKLFWPIL